MTKSDPLATPGSPGKWIVLALFLLLTVGGGSLIGVYNLPGEWYAGLAKPWFNPPNWLFGPVWTVLYAMIGIAGWRTWQRGAKGLLMQLWFLQLAVNFTWSPVFFTGHMIGLAALVIVIMVVLTILFIRLSWNSDRVSSYLMMPYLAWISFATLLNVSLWWLNR